MCTIPMGQFVQIECIMVGTRLPGVSGIMESAWHCYCECLKVLGKESLQRNLYSVFTLLLDPACLWLCPTKSCSRTSLILKSRCVGAAYFPIVVTIWTLLHPNLLDYHEPRFPWSNTLFRALIKLSTILFLQRRNSRETSSWAIPGWTQ